MNIKYKVFESDVCVTWLDKEYVKSHWKGVKVFDNLYDAKEFLRIATKNNIDKTYIIVAIGEGGCKL